MPVDDPARPRHVAWEHYWDVVVTIATTTAEGAPLSDSVDWDGDWRLAADRVEGVARAWAGQLVGLSLAAGEEALAKADASAFVVERGARDPPARMIEPLAEADASAFVERPTPPGRAHRRRSALAEANASAFVERSRATRTSSPTWTLAEANASAFVERPTCAVQSGT